MKPEFVKQHEEMLTKQAKLENWLHKDKDKQDEALLYLLNVRLKELEYKSELKYGDFEADLTEFFLKEIKEVKQLIRNLEG